MLIISNIDYELLDLPTSVKIYIGKSAFENTSLVKQFSNSSAIWYHLHNLSSPHIIVVDTENLKNKINITKRLNVLIGNLLKENSKYSNKKKLKLEYTEISNVKITNTPGLVFLQSKPYFFSI